MIDLDTIALPSDLANAGDHLIPSELLVGLLRTESVLTLMFRDGGAPPEVARREVFGGMTCAPGWLELSRSTDSPRIVGGATFVDSDDRCCHAVIPKADWMNLLEQMPRTNDVYSELPADRALEREQADALLIFGSDAAEADILVTERPGALNPRIRLRENVQVLTIRQALSAVGLYMRRAGEYIVIRSTDGRMTHRVSPLLFWRIASIGLVPQFEQIHEHSVKMSQADASNRSAWLTFSALERIGKALRARDQLHSTLLAPQSSDSAIVTSDAFDALLVNLTGLTDALARLADILLELGTRKAYNIGWQQEKWLESVRPKDSALANMMAQKSRHGLEFSILRKLRNCVHGEALLPVLRQEGIGNPHQTFIDAPPAEVSALLSATEQCGGNDSWGLANDQPSSATFDIGKLAERLTTCTLEMTADILQRLAVTASGSGPSSDGSEDPSEERRRRIMKESFLLQLGLLP